MPPTTSPDGTTPRAASDPNAPADPSPLELGRRIKLLRVKRNLTLKELEKRGGISATHVSEIERGKASPTVGALGRIARALRVRPASLIEPRVLPQVTISSPETRSHRRVTAGAATLEPLTEAVHASEVAAHLMTLPIGREVALAHHHEGEEWVTVLVGQVEIRTGEERHELHEGDSLHFRAEQPHAYLNPASSPAVLLIASRPRLAV
jgi:transcriptional regulator with XRE-family HTH domain